MKYSGVSSNSATVKTTKFVGPINLVCASTQLNAYCNREQPTRSLIDTGGAYHLGSSEYENRLLSTFLSGILQFPLVAQPGLT
jgi:hypothetical protein